MESNFDIYLTGEILPGCRRGDAVAKLAEVFNLEITTADQLLNGTRRRVKKNCNKAAALQFRKILTEAGLQVSVQRHDLVNGLSKKANPQVVEGGSHEKAVFESKAPTMPAELIQGLPQGSVDVPLDYEPIDTVSSRPSHQPYEVNVEGPLEVAPPGELLLSPSESAMPSTIGVAFDLAPTGALIPSIKPEMQPLNPKTDHLQLAPDKEG